MGKEKSVTVPNPDKEGHHQDTRRPGLYPSHPSRVVLPGRSGCGKGVTAKKILARAPLPFERIAIWHYDIGTLEWDDCDPSDIIAELPDDPSRFWDRNQKNLIICDEIPWEQLSKADRLKADRLIQYVCSHHNLTAYVLHQNFVSFPTPIRCAADWWNRGTCGAPSTMLVFATSRQKLATISANCFS